MRDSAKESGYLQECLRDDSKSLIGVDYESNLDPGDNCPGNNCGRVELDPGIGSRLPERCGNRRSGGALCRPSWTPRQGAAFTRMAALRPGSSAATVIEFAVFGTMVPGGAANRSRDFCFRRTVVDDARSWFWSAVTEARLEVRKPQRRRPSSCRPAGIRRGRVSPSDLPRPCLPFPDHE